MTTTTANFKFTDVLGAPLDDHNVIVDVLSLDNSTHFRAMVPLSGLTDVAINLRDAASGIYRFQLAPTNYRTTWETTSTTLNQLSRRGLIRLGRRKIILALHLLLVGTGQGSGSLNAEPGTDRVRRSGVRSIRRVQATMDGSLEPPTFSACFRGCHVVCGRLHHVRNSNAWPLGMES